MTIKNALNNILEGNLDEMRQNFSSALTTKAVEKLEERKIEIAKNYFGQMMEEKKLTKKQQSRLDAAVFKAGPDNPVNIEKKKRAAEKEKSDWYNSFKRPPSKES